MKLACWIVVPYGMAQRKTETLVQYTLMSGLFYHPDRFDFLPLPEDWELTDNIVLFL